MLRCLWGHCGDGRPTLAVWGRGSLIRLRGQLGVAVWPVMRAESRYRVICCACSGLADPCACAYACDCVATGEPCSRPGRAIAGPR